MVEKVDLSMIKSDASGPVISTETGLSVKVLTDDVLSGTFDRTNGTLILNIPNLGKIAVAGFTTVNDIGYGPAGASGEGGRDGIDGLMGTNGGRGSDGCPGPRGPDGLPGKQGVRGQRGSIGPTGNTGATGPAGNDGVVAIFIQNVDPSLERQLEAGTIWVRA